MSALFNTIIPSETIGISPGVGILSIFRYVKYKSWFALAEYVDNAIDSYLKNREALDDTYFGYQLKIDIELNQEENYIRISDNAAGIAGSDLERALRMAVRPPDRSGLSEFGMGMKAASCWFSPKWSVETQALGDNLKRKVIFDVQRIVEDETDVLSTNPILSAAGRHFTNIHLADVYSMPTQHGISKIREHLTSIYRDFIREDRFFDRVVITVNGKQLKYKAPLVLNAPPFSDKYAEAIKWRKELNFTCAGGQRVTGFAAIYPTAKTKEAGFALLRRGRVVEGSYDEPYRPTKIFGAPGSFYSQRIYGELHIDDFTASFTKDGVQWEDAEEDFLDCLKAAMKSPGLDLLKQANGMRVKELSTKTQNGVQDYGRVGKNKGTEQEDSSAPDTTRGIDSKQHAHIHSNSYGDGAGNDVAQNSAEHDKPEQHSVAYNVTSPDSKKLTVVPPPKVEVRMLAISFNSVKWLIYIELSPNPAHTDWLSVSSACIPQGTSAGANERLLGVRISLTHPFTIKYCASTPNQLEPLIRLAAALSLARLVAKEGAATNSSVLIDYVNELLLKL